MMPTKKQRAALNAYIRDLADRMELRDWSIYVKRKACRATAAAAVRCIYGRKIFQIKLGPDFWTASPERQRHYLCHELIHVLFWGIEQAMADATAHRPKHWVGMLATTVRNAEEYGVDAVAAIIAPFMPLPGESE